jgi:hypothetical protein
MSNGKRAKHTAALKRFMRMGPAERRKYLTEQLKFDPESIWTPAAQIETCRRLWMEEANPYRVWDAIDICSKHGLPFPDWICAYLADCASRMTGPGATHGDLRKALPKIMKFNMKPGANLLRPDGRDDGGDDLLLAMRFVTEHVVLGSTTEDALGNAYVGLNPALARMDSRSLLARIKKVFGIKRTPLTRAKWAEAIEPLFVQRYIAFLELAELSPNLRS